VSRWAVAEIDLGAIEHNVGVLRRAVGRCGVWAVVKADGYGHGAVRVAEAALAGGAEGLCVALVQEGVELREAGIDAPILVLSQQPPEELADLVRSGLIATVYSAEYAADVASVAGRRYPAHVKVDTGMQRVGVPSRSAAATFDLIAEFVEPVAVFTHLAAADDPAAASNEIQIAAFDQVLTELGPRRPSVVHAANSAAAFALPSARHSFVRAGIAVYGISPGAGVDHLVGELRPAMRLSARVSFVKEVTAGSHVSYGWRHRFDRDTRVATVPIGYADGVPRRLGTLEDGAGADVLVDGRRCPIVGVVTMDQLVVDVGDLPVAVGDEVVLLGEQGSERIRAEEWAARLGTIGYEIVCGIGARVPRVAVRG
jgi:alanine racemase